MEDDILIRAAAVIALEQAANSLKHIAEIHDRQDHEEYINNVLLIAMIGHCISTGIDKKRIVQYFTNILNDRHEQEAKVLIKEAVYYANTTNTKE